MRILARAHSAALDLLNVTKLIASRWLREQTLRLAMMSTLLGLITLATTAEATLIPVGSDDSLYRQFGEQFAGTALWIKATRPTGEVFYASAIRFNSEYGLTSGHAVIGPGGVNTLEEVGNGINYVSAPGLISPISSVLVHPIYDGTKFSPDIAIIRFGTPLPSDDLTIGSVVEEDTIRGVGFGTHGYPDSGPLSQDGNIRGWEAHVDSGVPWNVSSNYYFAGDFGFNTTGLMLNGKGTGGDSGGPIFDVHGNLVGITVAEVGGTLSSGQTILLKLDHADVRPWVINNVPEPNTLMLLFVGAGTIARFRRKRRHSLYS